MTTADKVFAGSIPQIYDQYMVPLIFQGYARDLAGRVANARPRRVLETAAGTGVLTRALAAVLPADAHITATDLNQPMLDYAAAQLQGDSRIVWRQADALALPFPDAAFDTVTCQFGVMFFPDRIKGYAEARRVLQPGGRFLFNVWDRIADNEFADVVTQALATMFPQDPPQFMARTPHGYHDPAKIRQDLAAAGFSSVALETRDDVSPADAPRDAAFAYCQGTPLSNEITARAPEGLEQATDIATRALEKRFGNGSIRGRIRAHIITASA